MRAFQNILAQKQKGLFYILFVCLTVTVSACTPSIRVVAGNDGATYDYLIANIEAGRYSRPKWLSDGQRIIVQFEPKDTRDNMFVILDVSGDQVEWQPLDIPKESIYTTSTPQEWDQENILYVRDEPLSTWEKTYTSLVLFNLNNHSEQVLYSGHDIDDVCRSNDSVVFIDSISHDRLKDANVLKAYDVNSQEATVLFDPPASFLLEDLACEEQGSRIAFTMSKYASTVATAAEAKNEHILMLLDRATNETTTLLGPSRWGVENPTWSPSGDWLAVRAFGDNLEYPYQATIKLIPVDGSAPITVAQDMIFAVDLDWSPIDNRLVVVSLDGVGKYSLHILDLSAWLR